MLIAVTRLPGAGPLTFAVEVAQGAGATRHRVTVSAGDCARLAGDATPERLVEAAFRFLLDREPKESILSRFDLSAIARYFPEFERELPRYLTA
ncbi:MAG: hypothetical protein E7774_04105 [Bradyrhizobium sp.]|nr:MAG: hypothetical protein E7774_04105 [Bradyrhizobium sp.]